MLAHCLPVFPQNKTAVMWKKLSSQFSAAGDTGGIRSDGATVIFHNPNNNSMRRSSKTSFVQQLYCEVVLTSICLQWDESSTWVLLINSASSSVYLVSRKSCTKSLGIMPCPNTILKMFYWLISKFYWLTRKSRNYTQNWGSNIDWYEGR